MYKIDKTFEFCYGHRVHTQVLNGEYADDLKCACRHLHGHEGKVQIFLESATLDSTGMVTDFRHLEWLKQWLNTYVDHRFIIDINDPLYNKLVGDVRVDGVYVPGTTWRAGYTIHEADLGKPGTPMYEYREGFLLVTFVPTSENLCYWLHGIVNAKMKNLGIKCTQVDWWETPRSRSSYHG